MRWYKIDPLRIYSFNFIGKINVSLRNYWRNCFQNTQMNYQFKLSICRNWKRQNPCIDTIQYFMQYELYVWSSINRPQEKHEKRNLRIIYFLISKSIIYPRSRTSSLKSLQFFIPLNLFTTGDTQICVQLRGAFIRYGHRSCDVVFIHCAVY